MSTPKKKFKIFLNNMVEHNIKKKIIFYVYHGELEYICVEYTCNCVLKHANIFQKQLKWFLTSIKFVISISYVIITHVLNHICEPCEEFDDFYLTNGGFSRCWPFFINFPFYDLVMEIMWKSFFNGFIFYAHKCCVFKRHVMHV
jgi:hypothetical protein